MANSEVINTIISIVADALHYMLPIIGVLSGIILVITLFVSVTIGSARKMKL